VSRSDEAESWSDAWFLAAAEHQQKGGSGAALANILGEGDYMNHAILTPGEVEHGVRRLVAAGLLIVQEPNSFRVTQAGRAMVRASTSGSHTPLDKISQLAKALDALAPVPVRTSEWHLDPALYRSESERYTTEIREEMRRFHAMPGFVQSAVIAFWLVVVKIWQTFRR
jgi:hypothetical protein